MWVQQNKTTWSANALLKDQLAYLSEEARDLLDCIFELDEKKRWVAPMCSCVGCTLLDCIFELDEKKRWVGCAGPVCCCAGRRTHTH